MNKLQPQLQAQTQSRSSEIRRTVPLQPQSPLQALLPLKNAVPARLAIMVLNRKVSILKNLGTGLSPEVLESISKIQNELPRSLKLDDFDQKQLFSRLIEILASQGHSFSIQERQSLTEGHVLAYQLLRECVSLAEQTIWSESEVMPWSLALQGGGENPFKEIISELKNHQGQILYSRKIQEELKKTKLLNKFPKKVQDPYSLRCTPQILGPSLDIFKHVRLQLNLLNDSPLSTPKIGQKSAPYNVGSFLIAQFDKVTLTLCQLCNLVVARTYRLMNKKQNSNLPDKLGEVVQTLLHKMTKQTILVRRICRPVGADSIETDQFKQDVNFYISSAISNSYEVLQRTSKVVAMQLILIHLILKQWQQQQYNPRLEWIIKSINVSESGLRKEVESKALLVLEGRLFKEGDQKL